MPLLQNVEAAARRHELGSSKGAVEARALRSALGMLPKTYMRLQRIFGMQGPNAMKLQQVRLLEGGLRKGAASWGRGHPSACLPVWTV